MSPLGLCTDMGAAVGTTEWYRIQWAAGTTTTKLAAILGLRPLQVATTITNLRRKYPDDFPRRRVKKPTSDQLPLRKLLGLLKEVQQGCTDSRLIIAVNMVEQAYTNRAARYKRMKG